VAQEGEALVAAGQAALQAGEWATALDSFVAALEHEESPEALAGLGDALWWLGEISESVAFRERAYAGFRRRSDPAQAATAALVLSIHHDARDGIPDLTAP
jgi:uncharacterized protein HemY